ncbi:MAG: LysR family transcriptional regulator [Lachnospiraceae bacterium]|jgi:DNA-binding transcriptional LysR family regulator|nr:LysR family transcriptional regulator [Lachnospiraceae bacterium]
MDLKEARYILAIAKHKNIGKAAESLFISQPSLSKYLKNLERQLGSPLFSRIDNAYIPTYVGERYLYYAEQIADLGKEWNQEYRDITHREHGRLHIAIPIMLGSTLLQPTLMEFHTRYPHITVNVMEEVNFIAEQTLTNHSIDLTFYNVHEFPKLLAYEIIQREEIVLILPGCHPLAKKAEKKPGFCYPWLDLSLLNQENFILLYPDQNTGSIALKLFSEYQIQPPILLHTRNSQMSIQLAMDGMGAAFAPASYFHFLEKNRTDRPLCFSIGHTPVVTTTIAAHRPKRYLSQYAKDYIQILQEYCLRKQGDSGN